MKKLANENKRKGEQKQRDEPESTHPAIFFFVKQKEDLTGGTTAAKTSLPLGGGSGVASTGAPEELGTRAMEELGTGVIEEPGAGVSEKLLPDDRLLQKGQDQSQNKEEEFSSKKIRKQLTAT